MRMHIRAEQELALPFPAFLWRFIGERMGGSFITAMMMKQNTNARTLDTIELDRGRIPFVLVFVERGLAAS